MKKSFRNTVVLALAGILVSAGLTSVASILKNNSEIEGVYASSSSKASEYTLTMNQIIDKKNTPKSSAGTGSYGIWSWKFDYITTKDDPSEGGVKELRMAGANVSTITCTVPTDKTYNINKVVITAQSYAGTLMTVDPSVSIVRGGQTLVTDTYERNTTISKTLSFGGTGNFDITFKSNNADTEIGLGFENTFQIDVYYTKYTVSFNANGHGSAPSSQNIDEGGKVSRPSDPTATGYTFGGWYKESGCVNAWNFNNAVNADMTLHAKWTATSYSLTYNLNGGSASNPSSYTIETNTFTLKNPTKTGYTFTGWSGTGISGTSTSVSITKGSTGNRTYTANYTVDTFTIAFDKNAADATGSTASVTATYDQTRSLTENGFSRTGYDFKGWATSSTGAAIYADQATLTASQVNTLYNTAKKGGTYTLYAVWGLKAEIQNVIDKINAIGNVSYPDSKAKIVEAEGLYEELDASYKPLVSNYVALTAARSEYDSKRETAINNVISSIDNIGEVSYPSSKQVIRDARGYYDALDEADKTIEIIPNYGTLTNDEAEYIAQRDAAVSNVITLINAIGEVSYHESKQALLAAEEAYAALDSEEKNVETITNYTDLVDARASYNSQRDDLVAQTIDAITQIDCPFNYPKSDEDIAHALELYNMLDVDEQNEETLPNFQKLVDTYFADIVAKGIESIGESEDTDEFRERVNTMNQAYNEVLTDDQRAFIPDYIVKILEDDMAAIVVMDLINDIGVISYTEESYNLINTALQAFGALTSDQKYLVANIDILIQDVIDYGCVGVGVDKVLAIGEISYTPECKALLDDARKYYDDLTAFQKSIFPVDIMDILLEGEAIYNAMDKIHDIGEMTNDSDCRFRIREAEAAYNALNDEQRDLVGDEFKKVLIDHLRAMEVILLINDVEKLVYNEGYEEALEEARDEYEALTADQKELVVNANILYKSEDDFAKVDEVVSLIKAIENIDYNLETKEAIEYARASYDELTSDQKAFFPLDVLNELKDYEEVFETLELINEIGEVNLSPESQAKVEEARRAYDSLSEEQKAMINAEQLAILTSAEESSSGQTSLLVTIIIIASVLSGLLAVGLIIFLILLFFTLAKRRKDKNPKEAH